LENKGGIVGKILKNYVKVEYQSPKLHITKNLALEYAGGPGIIAGSAGLYLAHKAISSQIKKVILKRFGKTVIKKVATQIAKRLVAKLVLRVAGIVGVVLSVWDAYKIATGDVFFDNLEVALLSNETQAKIKSEIISQLIKEIEIQKSNLASIIAHRIAINYKILKFRYQKAANIIASSEALEQVAYELKDEPILGKKFLDLVLLANKYAFIEELEKFSANINKLKTLLEYYDLIKPIIIELKDLEIAYEWALKADSLEELEKIVDLRLYKYFKPFELTKEDLKNLLEFRNSYALKMAIDVLGKDKLLKLVRTLDAYRLSKLEAKYGASFLNCAWNYYKENPKSLYYLMEAVEGHFDIVCNSEVIKYAKDNPQIPVIVAEAYDHRGFFSSITYFFKTIFGNLPMEIYRILYPKAFWFITIPLALVSLYLLMIIVGVISALRKKGES